MGSELKVEDLTRISLISNPMISKNGSKIMFVVSKNDLNKNRLKSNIWIHEKNEYYPLTKGDKDLCPAWSNNDELISFVRVGKKKFSLNVLKIGSEEYELITHKQGISNVKWSKDNNRIAFISRSTNKDFIEYSKREAFVIDNIPPYFNGEGYIFDRPYNLFTVSYPDGELNQITNSKFGVSSFDFSPDGDKIAYVNSYDELKPYLNEIRIVNLKNGEDISVLKDYSISQVMWSPKEEKLAFLGNKMEKGYSTHTKLYLLNLKNNEIKQIWGGLNRNIENSINSDVRGPSCNETAYWALDNNIYFLVSDQGRVHIYSTNEKGGLKGLLTPEEATIDEFSISESGTIIAYTQMTDNEPKELYLYDGLKSKKITTFNDELVKNLAKSKHLKAKSETGEELDYWVLLPKEMKEKNPWILYIHGGPKTFYGYSFNFIFHYLASLGYAVIYGNPHGSDAYTEEFADIRGKYGTIDYSDLMNIVDNALKQYKNLDPDKGAVAGGSYGGFMTNWIITKTNRFKAAITERSCSNWFSFYGASDIGWHFASDQLDLKYPWTDFDKFKEKSPLFYADKIETPLLIMHALEDYRCPYEQALQLFTALKNLGVETRLALFPGENHDLTRSGKPKTRIKYMEIMADWLKRHIS
ncbi:dipeptidyl aminopeptidase/acylaminoacyl peptidase [Caldisphaera lagunensis DSM 15908]|uniref:Dipeptidyl aminopeptidase/acylaminoacyl peptidase n=1 Tax=Caldisphaera lagunensis (strain DSM 15908 / JCM 11604 / ANMR 0165 / IC-154) TaxID=1056495 RepID=L0ACJ1_CALLD|nr:S9 family peptidase [Caldisphaera lagunensis]AFZ70775.1 dipeptidyl aminopeptidase/acylaminoacyl peptidase [Caldisphaera lagunensis DSM 15908]